MNYEHIFELINLSNEGYVDAERELIELGIYDDTGDIITEDEVILKFYEENFGML